jgi:hypothetical protein
MRAPQMFMMPATRHRSSAHREALDDPMAGQWRRGRHNEAGQFGN